MDIYKIFKPNLIPNSKVTDPIDLEKIIGDNVSNYVVSFKKDGCRLELKNGEVLTRALKPVKSIWIKNRYQKLADKCKELGIILEGEIYSHEMSFREIVRYFKTEDVTSEDNIKKLLKLEESGKLSKEWPGRTVDWLSTYHDSLKLWPFDLLYVHSPDIPYIQRIKDIMMLFLHPKGELHEFSNLVEIKHWYNIPKFSRVNITTFKQLKMLYNKALELGFEGLVIANKFRSYKFNRSTAKDNHLFKMKEDKLQYDGVVKDIIEGTIVREGAAKTINELGRSVTSKLAEDRIPSGMASAILTEYEGFPIKVSLQGYDHDDLRELLKNKEQYIGKWFRYTGMAPVKNVPRHAHASKFNMWRDDK